MNWGTPFAVLRKTRYTVRALHEHDFPDNQYKAWNSQRSLSELHNLFYRNLTPAATFLLCGRQSTWTTAFLEELAIDPRHLDKDRRRGCYMLAAIGIEDDEIEEKLELYVGYSCDMVKRFSSHVSNINNSRLDDEDILYFQRRCRDLEVMEPLFIPLSYEPTFDGMALVFQESVFIAIMGTWEAKSVRANRLSTWKAVRRMKLADEDDHLPEGWHGANREIPFYPTHGFASALLNPRAELLPTTGYY